MKYRTDKIKRQAVDEVYASYPKNQTIVARKILADVDQKYAELVILECIKELKSRAENERISDLGIWIEENLKDHFGF